MLKEKKFLFIILLSICLFFQQTSIITINGQSTTEFLNSATTQLIKDELNHPISFLPQKTLQGACSDGKYFYLIYQNNSTNICYLLKYDSNWNFIKLNSLEVGHGNDITYDNKHNRLVIVHNKPDYRTITFVNPNTLEVINSFNQLEFNAYSISYNSNKNQYVMGESGTEKTMILNEDFKVIDSFNGIDLGNFTHQGMESDENYIYYIQSNTGSYNRLVIYDWNGIHIKTIQIKQTTEGENIFLKDGKLYLGFNTNGGTIMYANLFPKSTTYSVKYLPNGGKGSMPDTLVTFGTPTELRSNTFTKKGFHFIGWHAYRESDNKWCCKNTSGTVKWLKSTEIANSDYKIFLYKNNAKVSETSNVIDDITKFYAQWEPNKFTIKYSANGGSGTMNNSVITYGVKKSLNPNKFTKKGHTFSGWNAYRESDKKWRYALNNSETKQGWYKEGAQPEGYTKYLYKDEAKISTTTSVNNDVVTLYAKWIPNKFTIIYESNKGSGTMKNTTVTYGKSTKLRANSFKRDGYSFSGWNAYRESDKKWRYALNNSETKQGWYKEGTQPTGYTKYIYKNEASIATTTSVNNDKVHLYALWKKI
ncbi:InlB B-repeat-containing protein [Erysipelotrichaceae bacterium HCN-30851]